MFIVSSNPYKPVPMTEVHSHATCNHLFYCLQDLYKQIAWPLYKMFGHAFDAFKLMVQDDGAAIVKRLEENGPLTVFTPPVSTGNTLAVHACRPASQPASISLIQILVVGSSISELIDSVPGDTRQLVALNELPSHAAQRLT